MSLDFISPELIEDIAQKYGYWAVFVGILLENLGLPIPGETVTIVGGFLAGSEQLKYHWVLLDAAGGAALGGTAGYWIGRAGGWPLLLNLGKLLRFQESQLEDLRQQFSSSAGKAVFFGRFIALLRVFASPLAGIAEMPFWKFTAYNVAGALTWATVMVSLAFFAGQLVPLEKLISLASQFALIALAIVVAVIAIPLWLESRKHKPIVTPQHSAEGE
ncbi:DedA family protein [Alkalinema sp. FACHB-956]|uniref:DedA family protein n=1 Tax=Alkalinema sp. FACHB-956 TaxID=2692768 RepID=UPI0016844DC3|nr:DedA family protein [Alkalinema sp. FACHB-956]MBD2327426.1 DedA family protein [Alkalinema sp. FACHB-956]